MAYLFLNDNSILDNHFFDPTILEENNGKRSYSSLNEQQKKQKSNVIFINSNEQMTEI